MKKIGLGILVFGMFMASCAEKAKRKKLNEFGNTTVRNVDVQHYVCPNECEGSGGPSSGTCPTCGSAYNHNKAFHGNSEDVSVLNSLTLDGVGKTDAPATPTINTSTSSNTSTTASLNKDVPHYKCSTSGCSGGSNVKEDVCPNCAGKLVHNQAYHNTPSDIQAPVGSLGSPFPQPQTLNAPSTPATPTTTTTTNNSGVPHYMCTQQGCGKGTSTNRTDKCNACGEPLTHNEAYHG